MGTQTLNKKFSRRLKGGFYSVPDKTWRMIRQHRKISDILHNMGVIIQEADEALKDLKNDKEESTKYMSFNLQDTTLKLVMKV